MHSFPPYVRPDRLLELIQTALKEDIENGDVTTNATIPFLTTASAVLKAKEAGIVAGLRVFELVLNEVDPSVTVKWNRSDGDQVPANDIVGTMQGSARAILMAERVGLNFLQRMSGIATLTHQMVLALKGTKSKLLDTRKTAPGLRMLDKWAVLLGGGFNHRVGLFDMILIKENHISAAGGIENALTSALDARSRMENQRDRSGPIETGNSQALPSKMKIEIEVTSLDELERVLAHGGADRVMLDNFVVLESSGHIDTSRLEHAIAVVDGRLETEASGNITLDTLGAVGQTGVDYISSGALTHSVRAMDFSLLITIDE
mgnify:CR=1 FL=1